jgi:hypothetical protein
LTWALATTESKLVLLPPNLSLSLSLVFFNCWIRVDRVTFADNYNLANETYSGEKASVLAIITCGPVLTIDLTMKSADLLGSRGIVVYYEGVHVVVIVFTFDRAYSLLCFFSKLMKRPRTMFAPALQVQVQHRQHRQQRQQRQPRPQVD